MLGALRKLVFCLPMLLVVGCGSVSDPVEGVNPPPPQSTNAAVFDPTTGNIPLPNVLVTATAADPLASRAGNTPMTPPEALAYINKYEMGSTNAVSGVNAPVYLRFTYPVDPASVTAATIKVFQVTPDSASPSATENKPLGFTDVSGMFTYKATAGSPDVWLFPTFPLLPGTRYLYVVTDRVLDADTAAPVIPSVYFNYLKSTTPLTGATAGLEPIRADVVNGANILFSGYAKVMQDLVAASATTSITSSDHIAVLGRFITSGAGFIVPDPAAPSKLIPVEAALRAFAAGNGLGGLPGVTWTNDITVTATFSQSSLDPAKTVGAYWQAATGQPGAAAPASLGQVILGTVNSALLSMDPVVVRANAATMNLSPQATTAFNPGAGVVQPFRNATGQLVGYYHVPNSIPFVYLAPAASAPSGGFPLVIYQHGITSSKETVLGLAQSLTGAGFAAVAIDLPLHGALAVPAHQIPAGATATQIATLQGAWGQDFMAVGAPLATRSNIQQAAFNLHRLELSVATGSFSVLSAQSPSFTQKPRFVGLSLGSIVGAYYLAGNTTLATTGVPYTQASLNGDMKGFLSVPGARTAYLIQASPAFGATVDAGLAQVGIVKNSQNYHSFFQLTQSVVDAADPGSMVTPLAAGLPSRLSGRIAIQEATSTTFDTAGNPTNGDLVITNPYTRYFGNALGGEAILGPVGAAVAPGFMQLGYGGGAAPRIPAPFMLTLNGTTPVPNTATAAVTPLATTPKEGYFQFDQAGISHGSLLDPRNPVNAGLMQLQMLYFLGITGTPLVVDPTQPALALH
jgi:hypothetical protein